MLASMPQKQRINRASPTWGSVSAALLVAACSHSVNVVRMGAHQPGVAQPVRVESAPPPARIEYVPETDDSDCEWLDGQWAWRDRQWRWYRGAWVIPPQDCYYAPPVMVWVASGKRGDLYYTHGRWYPDEPGQTCSAPMLCPSATSTPGVSSTPASR